MSKLSFRARALDATKPLPIYHADDLPDLSDFSTINRTVPQMPTGMEKEEESERHLQDVIQAKQTNSVKKKHAYIPIPEATIPVKHYDTINQKINRAHQYVRVPGLGLEEVPDYDLDSEDEEWLNAQSNERPLSPTHFERMMDRLEKGSGNTVLSEREAQGLLRDDENLVLAVYDYWLAKRLRLGRSLMPVVKQEGRDGGSGSNPYLAFRKRTEKMQTRKNRKNDETAYMQMLKLKRDLEKAVSLFEWVRDREQKKQELAKMQMNAFKKRYQLQDWSGNILSSLQASTKSGLGRRNSDWDNRARLKLEASGDYEVHHMGAGRKRKKRRSNYYYTEVHSEAPLTPSTPDKVHRDSTHDLSSDRLEDEEYEGLFSFKRKPHVRYHSSRDPLSLWPWTNEDVPDHPSSNEPDDTDLMIMDYAPYSMSHAASRERARGATGPRRKYRFSRASLSSGGVGLTRRRLGRGGRVLWDRLTQTEPLPSDTHPVTPTKGEASESMDTSTHFHPRTPSPSSSFEFTHLPLIELPGTTDNTSTKPPSLTPFSGISLAFRGIPLTTEFREDAKTFSSLPTSQFFLKSLTPHVDVDYQGSLLASDSPWGLVKGQPTDPRHRTTSEHSSNSPLHSPCAPGNYANGTSASDTGNDRTRHLSTENEQTKELSRSSLSVADSKTIVLSNVPLPRPKHQLEKSQRLSSSSENMPKDAPKTKPEGAPSSKDGNASTNSTAEPSRSKPEVAKEANKVVEKVKKPDEKVSDTCKSESKPAPPTPTPPQTDSKQQDTTTLPETHKKTQAAGNISTPADYIKNLDVAVKKPRLKGGLRRKPRTLIGSLRTATLITTQLGLFQSSTTKKKEPVIVPQNIVSAATELIASSSNANVVSSLNAAKLAELQSSLISKTPVSSTGLIERRTSTSNSSLATSLAVTANNHVGQALSSVGSAVARRGSTTGTNGTNYQEIFHTATRRISESAERGLKQALAGMNHNSLIETANSLVQLSNSSEVT